MENGDRIEDFKKEEYISGIIIYFNKSIYNNKNLLLFFIENKLMSFIKVNIENLFLLIFNCIIFYKILVILVFFEKE